jgi:hypothetical protein
VQGISSNGNDEENATLSTKRKKSKKGSMGGKKLKGEGKNDIIKFKCFAYHNMGHYVG